MGQRRPPGLFKRGNTWHFDKIVYGQRLRGSTGTGDLQEAEKILAFRIEQARQKVVFGVSEPKTFKEAATRYLIEYRAKRSIDRDARGLKQVMPYIGHLELSQVHMGTLQSYIDDRLAANISQGTVNRDLATVRRILNLSARLWRDDNGHPWLTTAPLIQMRKYEARKPYPLSFDEQRMLFGELAPHIAKMALFAVNTGARENEVVSLRWEWEVRDHNAFIIPARFVKNGLDRLIVCNSVAKSVIDAVRGDHPMQVFTFKGRPVTRIHNSGWKRARGKVGLPQVRVHDLKHTFGYRLRAAGVSFEDRQDLLGHKSSRITTHYSAPDVNRLLAESEKVVNMRVEPMLRVVDVESPHKSPTEHGTSAPQSAQVLDLNGGDGWT